MNLRNRLRRRHRFSPESMAIVGWKHPRPPRDPRIIAMHVMLPWVSIIQIIAGPPPASVQAQAFNYTATAFFAGLMIVSSLLVLYATFCESQYWSWGFEMAGCLGFTFVFGLYTVALSVTLTDAYASNGLAWAIALFVGNGWRGVQLLRRLW